MGNYSLLSSGMKKETLLHRSLQINWKQSSKCRIAVNYPPIPPDKATTRRAMPMQGNATIDVVYIHGLPVIIRCKVQRCMVDHFHFQTAGLLISDLYEITDSTVEHHSKHHHRDAENHARTRIHTHTHHRITG